MKFATLLLSLAFLVTSAYADSPGILDKFEKVKLRTLRSEDSVTNHAGILVNLKLHPIRLGVYGLAKNNEKFSDKKYSEELLGEAELTSWSLGANANIKFAMDAVLNINELEGLSLNSICGTYHGGKAGITIFVGSDGFAAMNGNGVILRSSSANGGFGAEVSYIKLKLKCLDKNNKNWKKILRF